MKPDIVKLSKFLSLILRHQPDLVGIELDPQGWIGVGELVRAINTSGTDIDEKTLREIVETSDKKRFAISPDGLRIRANQGHSIPIDLNLQSQAPPDTLFHGTIQKFLESIKENGLHPGKRHHVHLSADLETAQNVGSRRGSPIILKIDSKKMHQNSLKFFQSENGVWLTATVPPQFIEFPVS